MKPLRLLNLKSMLILTAFCIVLGGCSAVGFTYGKLDWLISWRLNGLLDLDAHQQQWLEPRIEDNLNWHCSTEIPRYLDWLQHTQSLVNEPNPSPRKLTAQFVMVGDAIKRIGKQITPTSVDLLKTLTDEQVAHLSGELTEKNNDYRKKFVDPSLAVQIEERAERMADRLETWLGSVNETQLQRVNRWSAALGEQNSLWMNNRLLWQAQMEQSLAMRHTAEFAPRITHLLQAPEDFYDAEYRKAYPEAQQAFAELISDVLLSADAQQKQRFTERLRDLRHELAQLVCARTVS